VKWVKGLLYFGVCVLVFALSTSLTIRILLRDDTSVACPSLLGLDIEEAKKAADIQGLVVHVARYEPRKDIPYNHVLVQKPDASTPVRPGRAVEVILSDGPKPQSIPDVVGLGTSEAADQLNQVGISIKKIIYVPGDNDGKILAQIPSSGLNILDPEGMVLIVAGIEKRFFLMPDIADRDIAASIEEMKSKGIKYTTSSIPLEPAKSSASKTKFLPKTIFSDDNTVELSVPVNLGG
jgi:beta-lactam-binding protein with PASTA domain